MWMFTRIGFFSAVIDPKNPDTLMVRARVRKDLERLRELLPSNPKVLEWEHRDYPYRVIVPKTEFAEAVFELTDGIDYPNFKDHVKKVDGPSRSSLYSKVWGVMFRAEQKLEEFLKPKSHSDEVVAHRLGLFDWE